MRERRGPLDSDPGDAAAEDERATSELIENVAHAVVARGMTAPAILVLESSKPLSFLGSQALHFLEPFVRALMDSGRFSLFAKALEDRENVERLLVRIEALDEEARAAERAAREERRAAKRRDRARKDDA
jgi:hypothetical protein